MGEADAEAASDKTGGAVGLAELDPVGASAVKEAREDGEATIVPTAVPVRAGGAVGMDLVLAEVKGEALGLEEGLESWD